MNVDELQVTDRNRNSMLGLCVCVLALLLFISDLCVIPFAGETLQGKIQQQKIRRGGEPELRFFMFSAFPSEIE